MQCTRNLCTAVTKLPEKDSFKLEGVILAYGFRHLAHVLHGSVNMESQGAHLMAVRKYRTRIQVHPQKYNSSSPFPKAHPTS